MPADSYQLSTTMKNPTFLIIGAAKSGTSALYSFLRQHPQIFMSAKKEPYYFALQGKPVAFAGPGDNGINHRAVTGLAEYESLFAERTTEKQSGEASTLYLYHEDAPENILRQAPDVKLIAVLRNPVDRAFSSYTHTRRDGWETLTSFRDALAAEPDRIAANWSHIWHYQRAGYYTEQLQRYFKRFQREQMLILLYDDLVTNPPHVLEQIYRFLDIDPYFEIDTSRRYNASGRARFARLQTWIVEPNRLKTMTKRFVPSNVRLGIRQALLDANVKSEDKPTLSEDDRTYLKRQFRQEIIGLQDLLGRDLSGWL